MLGKCLDDAAAGIVDENIELAEAVDCEIDSSFSVKLIREIASLACDICAEGFAQMRRCFFQSTLVEIGQYELGAVARQAFGNRKPDALGGTGDDRDVVLQFLVHRCHLFRG